MAQWSSMREPRFISSHRQLWVNFNFQSTAYRKYWKTEKEAENDPFKKRTRMAFFSYLRPTGRSWQQRPRHCPARLPPAGPCNCWSRRALRPPAASWYFLARSGRSTQDGCFSAWSRGPRRGQQRVWGQPPLEVSPGHQGAGVQVSQDGGNRNRCWDRPKLKFYQLSLPFLSSKVCYLPSIPSDDAYRGSLSVQVISVIGLGYTQQENTFLFKYRIASKSKLETSWTVILTPTLRVLGIWV